jgi:serine/threonine protein kinase/tetratricopeptide (TPR) repeat protein
VAQLPPELPPRYRAWPDPERALLGRGGAGEVWRAQDKALGVLVALKVWRAEGSKIKARLEREAALAARVTHPNVVGLHDVGTTPDGRPFLAFALASDGSLLEKVRSLPPWDELKDLFIGLLKGLAALHSRGLLHLDVKLSNLLLHRSAPKRLELWLADLGVARAIGDDEGDNTLIGTVAYMPAERLSAKVYLWGPATDLFSAGAVFYRVLSGQLPFPERDPTEALAARGKPPTHIPISSGYAVPEGIDDAILPMLQRNPWERYDLGADAIRAIEALPPVDASEPQTDVIERKTSRIESVSPLFDIPRWYRPSPVPPPRVLFRQKPPRRVPVAPSLLVHRDVPLIGRDQEMATLWKRARSVIKRRRPALVHVTGPRGIGRSRLVREFTRALEEGGLGEGVLVENAVREGPSLGLRGTWRRLHPPHPQHRSYVTEIATVLARDRQAPLPATMAEAELLANWIQPREGRRAAEPGQARALLVEHLILRSWRGLSWIWLDDMHLAEATDDAWALIDMVLARGGPVLVLVTTRSDSVSEPFLDLESRWDQAVETITLTPLKTIAASAFIKAHLPIDTALAQRLAHHTGGNPRAMRELLLHWVRTGALEPIDAGPASEPGWNLRSSAPPLPADRHAFARERLGHALERRPDWLGPLLTIAIAGRGTPERVIARVAGTSLDELVVEGLVDLQRGQPALSPPELPEAVREWPRDEGLDTLIHEHLAAAWAEEGDDPVVLGRVGVHRAAAGLYQEAIEPLDKALRALKTTLPLPEVIRLAGRTIDVAGLTRPKGDPIWAHAAMALSDALWHVGDGEEALAQDREIAALVLSPEYAVRAACLHAEHLGGEEGARASLDRLFGVEALARELVPRERAAFLAMRAWCRTRLLDVEGGLEDVDQAMRSDPDPETMVRCYLSRTMLLATRDPEAAYESARACIDLAHQQGLVRFETLAWGLCGPWLVEAGRAREAVDRLRSDIARLRARGEYRIVAMLLLTLGEIHRATGQLDDAAMAYEEAAATGARGAGSLRPAARVNLAILGAIHGDSARIRAARIEPIGGDGSALVRSWSLLDRIADLLDGDATAPADGEAIEWGVRLGADGVFLCRVIAVLLEERGMVGEASAVLDRMHAAAREHRIDVHAADDLVRRFIAHRPPRRAEESQPA